MTSEVDYEGELAVIIGAGGQVWGYTIVNDVTARDLQGQVAGHVLPNHEPKRRRQVIDRLRACWVTHAPVE